MPDSPDTPTNSASALKQALGLTAARCQAVPSPAQRLTSIAIQRVHNGYVLRTVAQSFGAGTVLSAHETTGSLLEGIRVWAAGHVP